jgi:hypothetical protein
MTLVELTMAMGIGVVVLLAAFMFLDKAFRLERESQDRTDSAQRGRLALEQMTRALRSGVCMGTPRTALKAADGNSVTFTYDNTDAGIDPGTGKRFLPNKRAYIYDPTTKTITQQTWVALPSGIYPNLQFNATPNETRTLLTNVVPAQGSSSIFSYYALGAAGNATDTPLTTLPLNSTDLSRAARVSISFTTRPTGKANTDVRGITLTDDVFVRSADPLNPTAGQTCL